MGSLAPAAVTASLSALDTAAEGPVWGSLGLGAQGSLRPTAAPPVTVTPTVTAAPVTVTPTVTAAPQTQTPTVTTVPVTVTPTNTAVPVTVTPTTTAAPVTVTPTVSETVTTTVTATSTENAAPVTHTPTVTAVPVTVTPTSTAVPVTVTPTTVAPTMTVTPTEVAPTVTVTPTTVAPTVTVTHTTTVTATSTQTEPPADLEVGYDISGTPFGEGADDGKITSGEQMGYKIDLSAVNPEGIGDPTVVVHPDAALRLAGVSYDRECVKNVPSFNPTMVLIISCPGTQKTPIYVMTHATVPAGTTLRTGIEVRGVNGAGDPRRVRGGPVTFHGTPTTDEATVGLTPFTKYLEFVVEE